MAASTVAKRASVAGRNLPRAFPDARDDLLKALADIRRAAREAGDEQVGSVGGSQQRGESARSSRLRSPCWPPIPTSFGSPFGSVITTLVAPHGDSSRRFSGNTRGDVVEELVEQGYRTMGRRSGDGSR